MSLLGRNALVTGDRLLLLMRSCSYSRVKFFLGGSRTSEGKQMYCFHF